MTFGSRVGSLDRPSRNLPRSAFLFFAVILAFPSASSASLPKRLILAIDGISYRDMKALQEGVTYQDPHGRQLHRQCFHQGYFPVSRNVSTFPSASDVAWTEIFGNRPLPGYQRTFFSEAANAEVFVNCLTTPVEYERQMTWRVEGGFRLAMSYVFPKSTFNHELHKLIEDFLHTQNGGDNYYAFIRSTDDAQHLACDILAMLGTLDEKLQELRALYRAREGRDLEILILSDHGDNHAGAGRRVEVRSFLRRAGYRITKSIVHPKDVVLPTAGIESWVELHNSPAETETLVELLSHLKGVDVVTARVPGRADRFLVMNSQGERASIEWNCARNSFRYSTETGDPLDYRPVLEALSRKHQLDPDGFATADAWMTETFTHRYPVALERIVRGHTQITLNPASILISLRNEYVHAGWWIKKGSEFVTFGGTHGALDDLNSTGIVLSNFAPTTDTSSSRVAALFDGFRGRRDYRAVEKGAAWDSAKTPAVTTITPGPLADHVNRSPSDQVFLRIWTPSFTRLGSEAPVEVTIKQIRRFSSAQLRRGDPKPPDGPEQHLTLDQPIPFPDSGACERVYALPPHSVLEPLKEYRVSGRIRVQKNNTRVFSFAFRTDRRGRPVAY